jgi:transposase-like protein
LPETALETALGEHLGHERGERSGSGNVRNGSSAKTLARFDDAVLSLHAKGITTGGIANHLADVYGTEVSRDLVSPVTDAVIEDMQESQSRPLDSWQGSSDRRESSLY